MVAKRAVSASTGTVGEAAGEALIAGNAVDAIVAGVLMAAAETPSVFLGPLQILVGGYGAGLQAVDGRVRQPGLGMPRPRGVVANEPIPEPAWTGVPALPASLALVAATLGTMSLWRLARSAVSYAKERSEERATVLEMFGRLAAAAITGDAIAGELAAAAGRSVGGALTRDDLSSVRPVMTALDRRAWTPDGILRVPWRGGSCDAACTQVIAAADARGLVAIACYDAGPDGLAIASLGLVAPRFASPVLRGERRAQPGAPRPAAAPIVLHVSGGLPDGALGLAELHHAEESLENILAVIADAPFQPGRLQARVSEGRPVAVGCL